MTANGTLRGLGLLMVAIGVTVAPKAANAQSPREAGRGQNQFGAADWHPEPAPPSSTHPIESARVVWPQPVRNVDHLEPVSQPQVETPQPIVETRSWDHLHVEQTGPPMIVDERTPHHVIQSPQRSASNQQRSPSKQTHAERYRERHAATHPPHLHSLQRRIQPVATVPDARSSETWKTPYSYGYFGAGGKRHWTQHHGYRDRYTQWTLR